MTMNITPCQAFDGLRKLLNENDAQGLPYWLVRTGGDEREIELRLDVDAVQTQATVRLHSDGTWSFVPSAT